MDTHNNQSQPNPQYGRPYMPSLMGNAVVTGGAGFIGSHLVDALMSAGLSVTVVDNLSSGSMSNLRVWEHESRFEFVSADLEKPIAPFGIRADVLFHLAANPEVRAAETSPEDYVEAQIRMMGNVLEFCRGSKIGTCVFSSSSTVYGDAEILPTPEVYEPLKPISVYGRTKLQCERLLTESCVRGEVRGIILRYANIVGPRSRHGVIFDLAKKLQPSPRQLEILGDGTQKKSYLHVSDCVEATLLAVRSHLASEERLNLLNVGNVDSLEVSKIAELVCESAGLSGVRFLYRPGSKDGRGWKGDVKEMQLEISRLTQLGWTPRYSSLEAVRGSAQATVSELRSFSA